MQGRQRIFILKEFRSLNSNYEGCNELIRKGAELYAKAHRVHQQLVSEEASGNEVVITLLLSHAQNILASADSFKVLCDEFIDSIEE